MLPLPGPQTFKAETQPLLQPVECPQTVQDSQKDLSPPPQTLFSLPASHQSPLVSLSECLPGVLMQLLRQALPSYFRERSPWCPSACHTFALYLIAPHSPIKCTSFKKAPPTSPGTQIKPLSCYPAQALALLIGSTLAVKLLCY